MTQERCGIAKALDRPAPWAIMSRPFFPNTAACSAGGENPNFRRGEGCVAAFDASLHTTGREFAPAAQWGENPHLLLKGHVLDLLVRYKVVRDIVPK